MIRDEAQQKGTGGCSAKFPLERGVPITAITEAVYSRALSGRPVQRRTDRGVRAHQAEAQGGGIREPDKIR